MDNNVVMLEVYTFYGISAFACHYYGEFHSYKYNDIRCRTRIMRRLNKRDAIQLNKILRSTYNNESYELYKVSPGDYDWRFDTKEDVIKEGIRKWRDTFPESDVLVDYHNEKKVYARR